MADEPRMPIGEWLVIAPLGAVVFVLGGIWIPLLAGWVRTKFRVPYALTMLLLLAMEMAAADWLFFAGRQRALLIPIHAACLAVAAAWSLLLGLFDRRRLLDGPSNLDGFVAVHICLLLVTILPPELDRAREIVRMKHSLPK